MYAQVVTTLLYLSTMQGELAHDPAVRTALWHLMEETHYGFAETEEALFIVRGRDGRLSFVPWTSAQLPHQSRWTGARPPGAVAIAHTHPNWLPQPSRIDVRTATRNKLAVYVVTRTRIVKTSGGETEDVVKGDWKP
jgi:proteasome lid subunit RPN8/RPN11